MVFTVIDIETTGLSKRSNNITEIAAARIRNGKVIKTYQTLINPQERIPSFITRLTGINNEMVKNAPTIRQELPNFMEFLKDDVFVAHNATFDFGFFEHNLNMHFHRELLNQKLCTKKLANRLYPELPSKKLGVICEHLNVKNTQAHRAMGDVLATTDVFNIMLNSLQRKGIYKTEDIIKFERSPARR
ncbi:MAG TPA: 3'-5' exonuclease [Candidatus Nanoarchaeia archaeon]|nr:3'-5' exonuclease [Candidatus Nanoarchaeia archaeon]